MSFIQVQRGDALPSVVTLQILLNAWNREHGAPLIKVDGVFGAETEAAVERLPFRRGRAFQHVWLGLVENVRYTHLREVRVLDVSGEVFSAGGRAAHFSILQDLSDNLSSIDIHGGLPGLISAVRTHGRGHVALLRFHGHGRPGVQRLDHSERAFQLSNASVHEDLQALIPLGHQLYPWGSVELHGSQVGAGVQGRRLLQTLASAWRVPVSAGTGRQFRSSPRIAARLEAPYVTAFPGGGSLSEWARAVQSLEPPGR